MQITAPGPFWLKKKVCGKEPFLSSLHCPNPDWDSAGFKSSEFPVLLHDCRRSRANPETTCLKRYCVIRPSVYNEPLDLFNSLWTCPLPQGICSLTSVSLIKLDCPPYCSKMDFTFLAMVCLLSWQWYVSIPIS